MVDLSTLLDAYTVRARLLPGLLTVLPVAVTVYAWEPGNTLGWNGLGALLTGLGGTYLLSFIARDRGKAAEARLYKKWGGRPTELALMHSGNMHPTLRVRRHAAIRRLYPDVVIPTAAEEAGDRDAAYAQFSAIVVLLLGHAKNKAKYPLVFEENCNYGFRRNMYGMRLIGLSVASICATALGFSIYRLMSSPQIVPVISLVLEAANVVMILVWLFWVNEAAVRRGTDVYADRFFEILDMLSATYVK